MVDKLCDHVGATAPEPATVDILTFIGHATMDIFGLVGFGYDFRCGESPEVKMINAIMAKGVNSCVEPAGFIAPVVLRAFPWLLKLPIKAIKEQGSIRRIVREIALPILQDREAAQENCRKDLLSVLLQMKDAQVDLDNLLDQVSTSSYSTRCVTARF